jgi:hypothetical protein
MNVVVEWLTNLLHIRKVLGSNLGRLTYYPLVFFLVPAGGFRDSLEPKN